MYCLPDVITHTYDPSRGAFRNICTLADADAERVLDDIRASARPGLKPNYLARRRATERWLMAERIRKLGPPHLSHPVYVFLGDFDDGLDPARPDAFKLPLGLIPPGDMTFTYPDSMASLPLATKPEHAADRRPYHGEVFTLAEVEQVVAEFGMPDPLRQDRASTRFDRFIEVQIWDDRPLRRLTDHAPPIRR